ncbi:MULTISPECIES: thioesterase II family protein [unclassified Streptomyces]|uniref:thioesterase II family protein n=1 Tax=unclassified Streptomyces TaxID=2593676 RepID=UPI0019054BBD|nr:MULTISPECIES: alpha/beta fold hydrolase [unclassified Streptomyces]MCU4749726.1 alpha/beta fold hydrolase [Streptomyces sp. G-5]QQN76039.1 thioesterase [Streptomyces sp. XC 2026]
MTTPAHPADWFVTRGPDTARTPRVYVFAHAGGDPRSFLAWQSALGEEARIAAVCPPGRGHRAAEPHPTLEEFADGAATAIRAAERRTGGAAGRPVQLFGHSLGGLVAFETARRLRDLPTLRHLCVSGISAPARAPSPRVRELAALEGREFAERLNFFEGLPSEVMAHDELMDLLLPAVIADFRMAAGYRYRPAAPLEVPVSVIAGRQDAYLHPDRIREWKDECRTPPAVHWVDGGHFYFRDTSPRAATDLLLAAVRADQHTEVI